VNAKRAPAQPRFRRKAGALCCFWLCVHLEAGQAGRRGDSGEIGPSQAQEEAREAVPGRQSTDCGSGKGSLGDSEEVITWLGRKARMSDESTVTIGDLIAEILKAMSGTVPRSGQSCPVCGEPIVAKIFTDAGVGYVRKAWCKDGGIFIPVSEICHVVRG
jgi:hypothetical protein